MCEKHDLYLTKTVEFLRISNGMRGVVCRELLAKVGCLQVKTDGNVDLDRVAACTEGFSGADLQAIASESQLTAVLTFLEEAQLTEERIGAEARKGLTPPCVTQQVRHAVYTLLQ
jgi:SpoVK/Ycf46/Vps4 family AAA+-type ATPase